VFFLHRVDGNDVLVTDGRGRPSLAREPLSCRAADRQLGGQHLNGHDAVQLFIEALEHNTHSTTADDFQDLVMVESP
jgi:hypothetical protein